MTDDHQQTYAVKEVRHSYVSGKMEGEEGSSGNGRDLNVKWTKLIT